MIFGACVGASCAAIAGATACVILDPPPDLPDPPVHPPIIISGSVSPPTSRILTAIPASFLVPVEIITPGKQFFYNVFVDYDPVLRPQAEIRSAPQEPPTTLDGGVYAIEFDFTAMGTPLDDTSRCHVIEIIVAFGFNERSEHTPDSNGGDTAQWFYSPTGVQGGCVEFGASVIDGAFPDANDGGIIVPPDDGGG
jgi:hypothetical protein